MIDVLIIELATVTIAFQIAWFFFVYPCVVETRSVEGEPCNGDY